MTIATAQNLTGDLLMAMDAVAFAKAAGIEPDDVWQASLLRSAANRVLLNIHRQAGKSLMAALIGVHDAVYTPGSIVLILSPSLRQSGLVQRKVMQVYNAIGRPVAATEESALQLTLANGSRIVALPGQEGTVRGYSGVTRLILDEASRIPDDLYYATRPMLAVSGGRLMAMSTPNGKRGWWHHEWSAGGPDWLRVEVPARHCARISAAFLDEERQSLGLFFEQEYECRFVQNERQVFSRDEIDAAFDEEVDTWVL